MRLLSILVPLFAFWLLHESDQVAKPLAERLSPGKLEESYRIYAYLLSLQPEWLFAIDRNTWAIGALSEARRIEPVKELEPLFREQIDDFVRANRKRLRLEDRFERRHVFVSGAEARTAACVCSLGCKPPETSRARLEGIKAIVTLSAVGFNRDGTRALAYVETFCGPLCGSGRFYMLAKKQGKWGPDPGYRGSHLPNWIS